MSTEPSTSVTREVEVDFEKFFLIGKATKVEPIFKIQLTEHTYLPKVADPRRDWVASVATPAFRAHFNTSTQAVSRFATVGTGAGLDAVAALEIFNLSAVAITDLHSDVVKAAAENIRRAAGSSQALHEPVQNLFAKHGDILEPLAGSENLPNIPISASLSITAGETSSTYVPGRKEDIPQIANRTLTALHWLALTQAKPLLAVGGSVLSSIGGRLPLKDVLEMAHQAGYKSHILTYTWKIQSEPEEVIGGYASQQKQGLGPFFFYPADVLRSIFENQDPARAGAVAFQIEEQLAPHRIDAVAAYEAHERGTVIGHTVVVIRSTLHDITQGGCAGDVVVSNVYPNAS